MTQKRFIKLITSVWHKWNTNNHGEFKEDLPLNLFLERHLRRGKARGYTEEYCIVKHRFIPYEI